VKSITDHLKTIRLAAMKADLSVLAWMIYFGLLVLGLLMIVTEGIFYLSPSVRSATWHVLFILGFLALTGLLVTSFFIFRNRIPRYRLATLARRVGALAFSKEDTVVNALQLERSLEKSSSPVLSKTYIDEVVRALEKLDLNSLFPSTHIHRWRNLTAGMLVILTLTILFTWDQSSAAVYRWAHPKTEFAVPKPFALKSLSGDIHLLGGESTTIRIQAFYNQPDTVYLELSTPADSTDKPTGGNIKTLSTSPDSNGLYTFTLDKVDQDYLYRAMVPAKHFWQAWREVSSPEYRVLVTDRPTMESFSITVIPPKYSRLKPQTQTGNQANVQGLKGSTIAIRLTSNRPLSKSYVDLDGKEITLTTRGRHAEGDFVLNTDGIFTINLIDRRGITNRDPIPYHLQVIPDLNPDLNIINPPTEVELGSDLLIPIEVRIEDDFGFSNLQVGYEVRRPAYLQAEPLISIFTIPIPDPTRLSQEIRTVWDLSDLGLMPEDEVHYHFELYDNDDVSGPKKSISGNFIARLPSLADLFTTMESGEQEFIKETELSQDDLKLLQERLEEAELDLIKSDAVDWEQQQEIKQTLEKAAAEVEKLQKLAENLKALAEMAEKHGLFSPELMKKFKALQELVNELISEEMLRNMDQVREALENMDLKDLMSAVQDLTQNVDTLEKDLDRFIDIFKRIQAEQKMDEVRKRLEQLTEQQQILDDKIRETDEDSDPSAFARLSQEEQWNLEEFQNIKDVMEKAAEAMQDYSPASAEALDALRNSDLADAAESDLSDATRQLKRQQASSAQQSSRSALDKLQSLTQSVQDIQQQFKQETGAEMAAKFQSVMRDILTLSKAQEKLREITANTPRNSPRMRTLAAQQQLLKDQLTQVMSALIELSKETFAITPEMGKAMGMAFGQMEGAKTQLAERNGAGARNSQKLAMKSLNQAALTLYNAAQQMQSGGSSASGFEQFMKQMQQMAGQQQGINNQGMQLALGQMAASARDALLQRMLAKQKQVRKSLQQLIEEMQQSGKQGLGDMSGIAREMDEVLKDIQARKYSRKTLERQQRILSRMLDSQKSLTQRGLKEERISKTAQTLLPYSGPAGLPSDLGQRRSLALEALNQAMKAGYSRDYQTMIRHYFNVLTQTENIQPGTPSEPPEERMIGDE